jgi:hypothetical protein
VTKGVKHEAFTSSYIPKEKDNNIIVVVIIRIVLHANKLLLMFWSPMVVNIIVHMWKLHIEQVNWQSPL